jgi:hypothetical protein
MKVLITLAGILLIAGGCYFVYDGYEIRQTTVARVEKEISTAIRALTDESVKTGTRMNTESTAKMIGGGVAVLTGGLLLIGGLRSGRRKRR